MSAWNNACFYALFRALVYSHWENETLGTKFGPELTQPDKIANVMEVMYSRSFAMEKVKIDVKAKKVRP